MTTQPRTPAGRPTGGEFASVERADSDIELDQPPAVAWADFERSRSLGYRVERYTQDHAIAAIAEIGKHYGAGCATFRWTDRAGGGTDSLAFRSMVDADGAPIDIDDEDRSRLDELGQQFSDWDDARHDGRLVHEFDTDDFDIIFDRDEDTDTTVMVAAQQMSELNELAHHFAEHSARIALNAIKTLAARDYPTATAVDVDIRGAQFHVIRLSDADGNAIDFPSLDAGQIDDFGPSLVGLSVKAKPVSGSYDLVRFNFDLS